MIKRKWSKVGWMGKNVECPFDDDGIMYVHIGAKGEQRSWFGQWPPRKVRVTVEDI